jgi:UTP--glucose-1-phosphate uridylyltransferase
MAKKINKAVIPVAGLGTRMLPATNAIPKELLPVYDRPIIEHVVQEAISGGITEIILVTRSGKEAIENNFDAHSNLSTGSTKRGKGTVLGSIKDIIPDFVKVTSVRQHDANAVETDAQVFDCGNKLGFLSANVAAGMRDPETKRAIKNLILERDA